MGSPSAVPVPCASLQRERVRRRARIGKRRLKQALLRLAIGRREAREPPVLKHRASRQPTLASGLASSQRRTQPSPRAKPSARLSNVCDRPATDVMPAMAMPMLLACSSIRLMPNGQMRLALIGCSARSAEWQATSDAEHAVSNEAHGPCSRAQTTHGHTQSRAHSVAYTLRPCGLCEDLRKLGRVDAHRDAHAAAKQRWPPVAARCVQRTE